MAIISFGRIDKKLNIIAILAIVRLINLIISNEVPGEYSIDILCSINEEMGPIIIAIIMIFLFKQKEKKKNANNKSMKYIVFLCILRLVKCSYEKVFPYIITDNHYRFNSILITINGLEIIMITYGTFILLKYKYYIHHMISMLIYCALAISIDSILGNFTKINYKYVYIYIIFIINEVLLFCYLKYMMDKLYYHYSEVILFWGIVGLIIKIFIFSGMIIFEHKNNKNNKEEIINGIKTYFTETNIAIIIFLQFFYYIIYGAFFQSLFILLLYYLKPNHTVISDELNFYFNIIIFKDDQNKYYTIIPFIFQILALLLYFEILELNFWGLNRNTFKNIQIRERKEKESKGSVQSEIDINDQYYLKENEFAKLNASSNYSEHEVEDADLNIKDDLNPKFEN